MNLREVTLAPRVVAEQAVFAGAVGVELRFLGGHVVVAG
jgi:hypothetical protein